MASLLSLMTLFKRFKRSFSSKATKQPFITRLPEELLVGIYQHLDSPQCRRAFTLTCKSFRRIAQQPSSVAAWMITRFGPRFAIYYAILTIPEQCDHRFLQYLFNAGARVPPCLVQRLIQTYGKQEYTQKKERRSSIPYDRSALSIQHIPFDGYAALITHSLKPVDVQGNILKDFFTSFSQGTLQWKKELEEGYFFPIITNVTDNLRPIIKLAQVYPKEYQKIAPLFEFDPIARASLWQAVLSVLFDEAFRTSELTGDRRHQLKTIQNIIGQPVQLVGTWSEQAIFLRVFGDFFIKYPRGYCDEHAMIRLLELLTAYAQPRSFTIKQALRVIKNDDDMRTDIKDTVEKFLCRQ